MASCHAVMWALTSCLGLLVNEIVMAVGHL